MRASLSMLPQYGVYSLLLVLRHDLQNDGVGMQNTVAKTVAKCLIGSSDIFAYTLVACIVLAEALFISASSRFVDTSSLA
jgi:hypothetical protein